MKLQFSVLILLFVCISAVNAQFISYGTIEPIDESYTDQSFSEFISGVKTAIINKDAEYIYGMLDDSIFFSFGDENPGKKSFRTAWKMDNPGTEFWEAFSGTLNLGIVKCSGDCDYNDFKFPYYQASGLLKDIDDVFSVLIIISPNANVYSSPKENSQVLTTLKYKAISFLDHKDGWFTISMNKNKTAYIKEADARRYVGLRGGFKKKNNEWKLVCFVEGD